MQDDKAGLRTTPVRFTVRFISQRFECADCGAMFAEGWYDGKALCLPCHQAVALIKEVDWSEWARSEDEKPPCAAGKSDNAAETASAK